MSDIPVRPDYEASFSHPDSHEADILQWSLAQVLEDLEYPAGSQAIKEVLASEGTVLVSALSAYGLDVSLATEVDELIHDSDSFDLHLMGSSPFDNEPRVGIDAVMTHDTVRVRVTPAALHVFTTNAICAIEPVSGKEEIMFARDIGAKMMYVYAATLGAMTALTDGYQSSAMKQLLLAGKADLPAVPDSAYQAFVGHRLAARMAIDRLEDICTEAYGFGLDGGSEGIVHNYHHLRASALEAIKAASHGQPDTVDAATRYPLSPEATSQLLGGLAAARRPLQCT